MAHNAAGHSTLRPDLGLLNHFKILNSLINILWRAQGRDEACFSPGRVLIHGPGRCEWPEGSASSGEDCRLCSEGSHLMKARTRRALGSHVVPVYALKGKENEDPDMILGHPEQN